MSTQGEKERSKETLFRSCRRLVKRDMSVLIFHIFNYTDSSFFIVIAFVELFKFLQLPHSRRLRLWAVGYEVTGGTNGKAFRHPTFCISRIVHVRRDKYRELPADGQSPQEYVGSARQMTSICPSLPMYTCFLGLPFPLFSVHCQIVPIDTRVLFYTVHILSYHTTVTRLSASHQVGEPSSSPVYVVTTANRHFFLSVSGRSVWAAKLWPRISALQVRGAGVSLENLHTLTR